MTLMKRLTLGTAVLALSAGLASAATISGVIAPTPDSWAAADLSNTTSLAGGTFDLNPADITKTGSATTHRSPFEPYPAGTMDPDNILPGWETLSYFSVGSDAAGSSPVKLSFAGVTQTSFSLLWGSVDTYNALRFLQGDTEVGFVTGGQVLAFAGADPGPVVAGLSAAFVTITGAFDSIEFYSNFDPVNNTYTGGDRPAFEFASMTATPIPLPAPAFLLLGGMTVFGGMAALRRRKQKAA